MSVGRKKLIFCTKQWIQRLPYINTDFISTKQGHHKENLTKENQKNQNNNNLFKLDYTNNIYDNNIIT